MCVKINKIVILVTSKILYNTRYGNIKIKIKYKNKNFV